MPVTSEPTEWTTHHLAGPGEHECMRLGVVCTREWFGQPRMRAVGLGRALIEVQLVPGGRPGRDLPRQLPVLDIDHWSRHNEAGLRVFLGGGNRKVDGGEALWCNDRVRQRAALGIEGGRWAGLVLPGFQTS